MPSDQEYAQALGIDAETGGASAPDTASTPAPAASEAKPVEYFELGTQRYPTTTEFKVTHDGKIQNVPYSTMANAWRQAQHFEGKYKSFNQERQIWAQEKAKYDAALAFQQKYGPLQKWSEKNPKDWETIWNLYQNRDQHILEARAGAAPTTAKPGQAPGGINPALIEELTNLKKTVGDLVQTKTQFDQYQNDQRMHRDTQQIWGEKEAFQKSYPEINLDERDPDGVTLWAKVMQHGVQQRIPNFKTAAMDYLEARLQDTWAARSRNEAVKGLQTERRQGIVQRSATPIQGQGPTKPIDIRKLSYAEIAEMAKNGAFAVPA